MNEITRIHIAKVPYDIEISAKKELEKYTEKLALYADDGELLGDIEIRITELLTERGIEKDGIISSDDVAAIRAQLGDPKDFLGDGDIAVGAQFDDDQPRRRLYRDLDGAVVGGVLSGMAKYLDTNPLWPRLTFIILLFISFGTALIVYLVLWLIVPAARSAAEKLELAGKSVTLASIKELSEQVDNNDRRNQTAQTVRTVLRYTAGMVLAIGAATTLLVTVWAAIGILWGTTSNSAYAAYIPGNSWILWTVCILCVLSGLLCTALLTILSRALFKKRWTKHIGIATAVITAGGMLAFGTAVVTYSYSQWQAHASVIAPQSISRVSLPDLAAVKTLTLNGDMNIAATIVYTVDAHPHYELTGAKDVLKPIVTISDTSATVDFKVIDARGAQYAMPILQIYGPALDTITIKGGYVSYYNDQASLQVVVSNGSMTVGGTLGSVSAMTTDMSANIDLSGASITNLTATTQFGTITAGVTKSLTLTLPEACPSHTVGSFSASAVTSGTLMYNGSPRAARSFTAPCGIVSIGEDEQ